MQLNRKKWLVVSLVVLFVATFAFGCSSDDDDGPSEDVGVQEDAGVEDVGEDVTDEDASDDTGDEPDAPPAEPEGEFSFNYANGSSGQFSVAGNPEFPGGDSPEPGTFAMVQLDVDTLVIGASEMLDDTNADVFVIMVPGFSGDAGAIDFESDCMEQTEPDCAMGVFLRNIPFDALEDDGEQWLAQAEEAYLMGSGALQIDAFPDDPTADSQDPVDGGFQGTATLYESDGNSGDPQLLDVTDGSFEIPFINSDVE
ncbi:MAG: hypothetical protein ACLFVJ_17130 [Persicimonas sp.]